MEQKTKLTHEGAALMNVMFEAMGVYFRLRDAGKHSGHVTPGGAGIWGFLHSLALDGPQTVPQLARIRPVSRQHIQKIANEAEAEGLIEFIDNPAHKRSRLIQLTERGRALHKQLTDNLAGMAVEMAKDMASEIDVRELETAARVLNLLRSRLAGAQMPLGKLGDGESSGKK